MYKALKSLPSARKEKRKKKKTTLPELEMELSDKSDCFACARPESPFLGLAKTKLAVTIT